MPACSAMELVLKVSFKRRFIRALGPFVQKTTMTMMRGSVTKTASKKATCVHTCTTETTQCKTNSETETKNIDNKKSMVWPRACRYQKSAPDNRTSLFIDGVALDKHYCALQLDRASFRVVLAAVHVIDEDMPRLRFLRRKHATNRCRRRGCSKVIDLNFTRNSFCECLCCKDNSGSPSDQTQWLLETIRNKRQQLVQQQCSARKSSERRVCPNAGHGCWKFYISTFLILRRRLFLVRWSLSHGCGKPSPCQNGVRSCMARVSTWSI